MENTCCEYCGTSDMAVYEWSIMRLAPDAKSHDDLIEIGAGWFCNECYFAHYAVHDELHELNEILKLRRNPANR